MYKKNIAIFIILFTTFYSYTQEFDPKLNTFSEILLSVPLEGKTIKSHDRYSNFMISKKSSVALSYSTREVSRASLKSFAIVQFIKGCRKAGDHMTTRDFWGLERQAFNHHEWEIDSIDTNPIYQSFNEYNHSGYYFFAPKSPTHPLYSISSDDEIDFLSSNQVISKYALHN